MCAPRLLPHEPGCEQHFVRGLRIRVQKHGLLECAGNLNVAKVLQQREVGAGS